VPIEELMSREAEAAAGNQAQAGCQTQRDHTRAQHDVASFLRDRCRLGNPTGSGKDERPAAWQSCASLVFSANRQVAKKKAHEPRLVGIAVFLTIATDI
jgi:hypothetical protein